MKAYKEFRKFLINLKFIKFTLQLIKKSWDEDLLFLSNALTFRILIAFFPFLIFLLSLFTFFNLDKSLIMETVYGLFPEEVYLMLEIFLNEILNTRNATLLITAAIVLLASFINSFRSVNCCYSADSISFTNQTNRKGNNSIRWIR